MKIRKVDGYWNYDKSEFEAPSKLMEDEDKLEELYNTQYPLAEFTVNTNFKSYDALKTRLNNVLAGTSVVGKISDEEPVDLNISVDTEDVPAPTEEVSDEDTMSYFEKLASET